ncbi:MAG: helix-turn-helix transcriptional regulator [Candidatus Margulisiibacteriota bacterium]|nr:helix-turn-helix transcriptional regulator [Candidatus Margulisiibacteriota bacterium]
MSKVIYSKEHKKIVDRLKQARNEAGFDQNEVADRLNKSQSYLSKIELGQRRIDIIQLRELASIYGKDVSFFID